MSSAHGREPIVVGVDPDPSKRLALAWAADEAMVGHWPVAFKTIDRLSRNGKIHGERSRVKFEQKLRSFLRRTGYL